MTLTPAQEWWTPEQIAESGLPDLPATKRGVNALADRLNWRAATKFARRRSGKGGGWEYSWKLFPNAAQRTLIKQAVAPKAAAARSRDEVWAWYEALPQAVKDKAQARLLVIQKVEVLEGAIGRFLAVEQVAKLSGKGFSARNIWELFKLINGIPAHDRLAYLPPRNRAAEKRPRAKECSPEFFDVLKSDYLRLEAPPFTDCYRRAVRVAKDRGLDILPERTMRRHLDAAVSRVSQVLARQGVDAVKRLFPSQVRDKTCLVALQAVNADFHKFDVFVRWPSVGGEPGLVTRPQMVAFQDIYSGRILSWRIDQTPNSTAVMLCAGDMIETWGIPEHVLLDNGREFAAKAITGGAATRFRFKVKEDDIPGLFTALGCTIHWATPYSGQSKPIERAFRDMCQSIAKDPRLAGAYTGNTVMAKPENYGSRAVGLEEFIKVVAEGIEEHNARENRRSEVAFGRSFNVVFDESYQAAPIRKATEAQRRLWLLGAEGLRADSRSGSIRFQGNEFWEPWLSEFAGTRVVIRFDPADLWTGVHVYAQNGAYLGHAGCRQKVGFFDMDEARIHARLYRGWLKAQKAEVEAHRVFKAAELGMTLDGTSDTPAPKPEAKVVRAQFGKPATPEAIARPSGSPPIDEGTFERIQAGVVASLDAARAGTGNLVANFNDIGMMLAAGQNPLQLAIQQGTAITQVIGPMGAAGAAKALGTAFVSMLSPLNLVTLGVIAAGGAMIQWLTSASDEAQTAEDRIKALTDATEAYRGAAEAAGASVDSLRDKYGSLAMVAALALRDDAERKKAENLAALAVQVDGLANTFGSLHQEERTVLGYTAEVIPAFERLQNRFNFTEAAASQFLGKLRELETAQGPIATANAAREIREWLEQAYGSAAKLPPEMAALYNALNDSTIKSAELQGTLDLVAGTAQKVDSAAAAVSRTLASADGNKLVLAFQAAFPAASQLLGMAQSIISTIGGASAAMDAQAQLDQMAIEFSPGGQANLNYGGRTPGGTSTQKQLGARNTKVATGGGGGGGAAARDEANALQELIASLEAEIEALHVQDPIQQEMLKHREALAGATEAERQKVEELIATREREAALMEGAKARAEFFGDIGNQALDALIFKGESFNDVLKGIISSLIKAIAQAALFGSGPFGSLFGGSSIMSLIIPGAKAEGGMVYGPGTGTSDSIPTMLSNGEFVVNAAATARNRHLLEAVNSGGRFARFAEGGFVGLGNRRETGRGGSPLPASIYMDFRGTRGDREIEEIVREGAAQMIALYDREGLATSVQRVSGDPRRRG